MKEGCLLILDDLVSVTTDSKENLSKLNNYAIKDCHHENMSITFICQDLVYRNEKLCQGKNNSIYKVLFDNEGD